MQILRNSISLEIKTPAQLESLTTAINEQVESQYNLVLSDNIQSINEVGAMADMEDHKLLNDIRCRNDRTLKRIDSLLEIRALQATLKTLTET